MLRGRKATSYSKPGFRSFTVKEESWRPDSDYDTVMHVTYELGRTQGRLCMGSIDLHENDLALIRHKGLSMEEEDSGA
jgi:hypothetical protein